MKGGRLWERQSNRLEQNKRYSLLPHENWEGRTKRVQRKDRERRFGVLPMWSRNDGNWYSRGLWVYPEGKMGYKMENLEADGPKVAMERYRNRREL